MFTFQLYNNQIMKLIHNSSAKKISRLVPNKHTTLQSNELIYT